MLRVTADCPGPEHFLSHENYLRYQQSLNVGITRRHCGRRTQCAQQWDMLRAP